MMTNKMICTVGQNIILQTQSPNLTTTMSFDTHVDRGRTDIRSRPIGVCRRNYASGFGYSTI